MTSAEHAEPSRACDATVQKPLSHARLLAALHTSLAVQEMPERDAPRATGSPSQTVFVPLRILVAEDNEFNQVLISALLGKRGTSRRDRDSRLEALERLEVATFDLMLLLDLHMPDLDGFQVVARIRERERERGGHLPVIACTARSRREDEERCIAFGMDQFITKPIRSDALWTAIDRCIFPQAPDPIDRELLLSACDHDSLILANVCRALSDQLPLQVERALACLHERDAEKLQASAHRLRGIVGTVSLRGGLLAAQLEEGR